MTYGLMVQTSLGMADITQLSTARLVAKVQASAISGTAHVPAFSAARGDYFFVNRTARLLPASQWNETSQTLSWWKPDGGGLDRAYSDDFLIIFVETL